MRVLISLATGALIISSAVGCTDDSGTSARATVPAGLNVPSEYQAGEQLYNEHCSECHGARGSGTDKGNPLVDVIYEPGHHGDASFQVAVANGAQQHHWEFGNMDPIPGVSPAEVTKITEYIRFLQRQAGIQ